MTQSLTFADLGLNPALLDAVAEQGYQHPSPIQAQAIPAVLEGKDVMAAAQTGTGKTAGFTLPLLHLLAGGNKVQGNQVRALVLTPTRELAAQVGESVATYGKNLPLRSQVVFGGVKINPQMMGLRRGADVLVATPGRLLDLYQQNAVRFKQLEVLVLDEADRMLDMGFIHDIKKILALLPAKRQNLLFSATFSDEIRALAKGLVNNPVEISVTPPNSTAERVEQAIYPVDKNSKASLLCKLIKDGNWQQVLVFTRTKHGANRLAKQLESAQITAAAIHGNKSQSARTKALADFKAGAVRALVATDIAARGLDIDQLPQVVNFDLPNVAEDYVHRIGRTGRAGASGHAVSLVCSDETKELKAIERLIGQVLPREKLPQFEPINPLPETSLDTRPQRPKKPKKPKAHQDGQRSPKSDAPTQGQHRGQRQGQQSPAGEGQQKRRRRRPSGPKPQ
ncbi:DEAD/DEAH box helicase [Gallaecimonas pentaromativorans]|uniref:ATP-dependent RNA helicase RhlE n=1 Tax=Gallaecimonas pentaromativorans TaxID=584787 RepID=A0A3N1Q1D9_9GAMM|nr:DEAD/DEAH box helicase [Gallaecimonas pentaromativorans]MED5523466.1 DEAD/DEAH box helicase [Pseudomonadota bacterium]ROQ30656.1 ATP-dependent RNA helicase RhlE [Gallaecimonas pentaromativorans]